MVKVMDTILEHADSKFSNYNTISKGKRRTL